MGILKENKYKSDTNRASPGLVSGNASPTSGVRWFLVRVVGMPPAHAIHFLLRISKVSPIPTPDQQPKDTHTQRDTYWSSLTLNPVEEWRSPRKGSLHQYQHSPIHTSSVAKVTYIYLQVLQKQIIS